MEIVINLGIGQAGAKMVPFSQREANSLKFVNVGKKLDKKFKLELGSISMLLYSKTYRPSSFCLSFLTLISANESTQMKSNHGALKCHPLLLNSDNKVQPMSSHDKDIWLYHGGLISA